MQNRSISRNKDQIATVTYVNSGQTTSTTNSLPYSIDQFSYDGFGTNDPYLRKRPTSGNYSLTRQGSYRGSKTTTETYYGSPQVIRRWEGNLSDQMQSNWPAMMSAPSYSSTIYNEALSKLYDKIREREANIALSIGEGRETAKMLNKAVRSMGEILLTAKRAKRQFLQNPSKSLAEVWLSYKYGWAPLYQDVYSYLEFTTRKFDEMTFVGSRSRKVTYTETATMPEPLPLRRFVVGTELHRARISVTTKVSDSAAFDRSRITSLNPLSIGWELVPFSFVVDWFYDVGGYLALQEAALGSGLTFVRGHYTLLCLQEASATASGTWGSSYYPYGFSGQCFAQLDDYYKVIKQRVVLSGFPRPQAPRFEVKLGWQRILSAASLIRVVLLGGVHGKRV